MTNSPFAFDVHAECDVKNSLVVFHHIPKCAGTSISMMFHDSPLYDSYPAKSYLDWMQLAQVFEDDRALGKRGIYVGGHESFGMHELPALQRDIYYFTFLRHPVALFHSFWNYHEYKFKPARTDESKLLRYPSNMMVRFLGNGSLSSAKERLKELYFLFGIVERFDDSVEMLAHYFNLPKSKPKKFNVSKGNKTSSDTLPREDIEVLNSLDMELYDWASDFFDKRHAHFAKEVQPAPPLLDEKPSAEKLKKTSTDPKIQALIADGQFQEAIDHLERIEYTKTSYIHVPSAIARLHERLENHEQAKHWHLRALENAPLSLLGCSDFLQAHYPEDFIDFALPILQKCSPLLTPTPDSSLNRFYLKLVRLLFTLPGQLLRQKVSASELHATAQRTLEFAPDCFPAVTYLFNEAKAGGDTEDAVSKIRRLIMSSDSGPEIFSAAALLEGLSENGGKDEVLWEAYDRAYSDVCNTYLESRPGIIRREDLGRIVFSPKKTLVVRAAPVPVLDHFTKCLQSVSGTPDILLQESLLESDRSFESYGDLIQIPDGMFHFSDLNGETMRTLSAKGYDTVVILALDADTDYYEEWLKMPAGLGVEAVCFFPAYNCFMNKADCWRVEN